MFGTWFVAVKSIQRTHTYASILHGNKCKGWITITWNIHSEFFFLLLIFLLLSFSFSRSHFEQRICINFMGKSNIASSVCGDAKRTIVIYNIEVKIQMKMMKPMRIDNGKIVFFLSICLDGAVHQSWAGRRGYQAYVQCVSSISNAITNVIGFGDRKLILLGHFVFGAFANHVFAMCLLFYSLA